MGGSIHVGLKIALEDRGRGQERRGKGIEGPEESSEVERAGHDLEPCGILTPPLSNGGCPWGSLFPHL